MLRAIKIRRFHSNAWWTWCLRMNGVCSCHTPLKTHIAPKQSCFLDVFWRLFFFSRRPLIRCKLLFRLWGGSSLTSLTRYDDRCVKKRSLVHRELVMKWRQTKLALTKLHRNRSRPGLGLAFWKGHCIFVARKRNHNSRGYYFPGKVETRWPRIHCAFELLTGQKSWSPWRCRPWSGSPMGNNLWRDQRTTWVACASERLGWRNLSCWSGFWSDHSTILNQWILANGNQREPHVSMIARQAGNKLWKLMQLLFTRWWCGAIRCNVEHNANELCISFIVEFWMRGSIRLSHPGFQNPQVLAL